MGRSRPITVRCCCLSDLAESQDLGRTIGAGVDVPLDQRLSLVVEYRYTDYGSDVDAPVAGDDPYDISASKLYLGLNFRL
jgi:opacity protein-like surface antigen